ncbi:glycoside hydrolase family 3 C-terminal domain-containing protein [Bifidobacterium pullorum subsp. saeculare]|uniref:exo-alpha-(1->6)-L-arabinopyranosidase n=1 Tax=Bifidobacterium pullorum TaxID=78448 RepID=UPI00195764AC|nr:exo-alpha-(1->6)-L-arabinopyranosidase [Bifidobacterium pullorum]MBM6696277.1 glycoside hydrolase family 3 C-terminal domain-containing protein [Bifidobacterium pullorum subsp. saeculare]
MSDYPSVNDLTLEEKAALTSGTNPWSLGNVAAKGLPNYTITDGPHGLRKAQNTESMDVEENVPATCFPPAAGMACSWNPELVERVGEAMGEECIQEQVAVILGPGVNIKRNPLGGRCFEYWSEDPYLAGHTAVGIVKGVQSKGVGTSLKHFAANNQETDRLRISATISPRAMREIYLPAFEYIVKTAQPWTVMCSYNKINGVFSSQNRWLLTDVLRGEWGFKGIVMSDWGAVSDRVAALNAGLNLEMPPSNTDNQIVAAVKDGRTPATQLDEMAQGMVDLVAKARPAMSRDGYRYDVDAHNEVARQAAVESMVLLKNEDATLPVAKGAKIAVIGEFARTPRYQGAGSSLINPTKLTSFLDAIEERGVAADFAPGFTLDDAAQDPALTEQAVTAAQQADVVLLFLGLPAAYESEGFDRTTLDIPAKQVEVLDAVAAANPNVAVVLSNGSVVSLPWQARAKAILETWLLGQAGGAALADVIFGDETPSGKLAQTIIDDVNDDPSAMNWPGEEGRVDYGEGVFVGYRYYDTFRKQVTYPFGYGLSYATFDVHDATVAKTGPRTAEVIVTVTNTSDVAGAETVQVYVAPPKAKVARPVHELKGFAKVALEPGESKNVTIALDDRAFAYWSERFDDWHVEGGTYTVEIGVSSRDIISRLGVEIDDDGKIMNLDEWSTFGEWLDDPIGAPILQHVLDDMGKEAGRPIIPDSALMVMFLRSMPLRSLSVILGESGEQVAANLTEAYRKATA